jgi:hypothetical protein
MEKHVPTKNILEAVGSWFPALRVRFCARALRALAHMALGSRSSGDARALRALASHGSVVREIPCNVTLQWYLTKTVH